MPTVCRLCHGEGPLVESHIFPEFLHKPLYDDKHRFELGSLEAGGPRRSHQKGLRERLLCAACEGEFSKLERYTSQLLFYKKMPRGHRVGNTLVVTGVDYRKFKLFLLSLIWRAGVSSLEPFGQVVLGPHEEKLRRLLHSGSPGPRHVYPCVIRAFTFHKDLARSTIIPPYRLRVGSHQAYRALFAGLSCTFFISSHVGRNEVSAGVMTEEGHLPIVYLTPEQEDRFFRGIAGRMPDEWLEEA